jgi:hypothetical protein
MTLSAHEIVRNQKNIFCFTKSSISLSVSFASMQETTDEHFEEGLDMRIIESLAYRFSVIAIIASAAPSRQESKSALPSLLVPLGEDLSRLKNP